MTDNTDRVPAAQLTAGDIISFEFASGGFDTAVVSKVTHDAYQPGDGVRPGVEIVRPFAVVTGFSSCAVVSFGQEVLWFALDDPRLFLRLQRSDLARHEQAIMAERKAHEDEIARLKDLVAAQQADLEQRGRLLVIAEDQRRAAEALALQKEGQRVYNLETATRLNSEVQDLKRALADAQSEAEQLDGARRHAEDALTKLQHAVQLLGQSLVHTAHPASLPSAREAQ